MATCGEKRACLTSFVLLACLLAVGFAACQKEKGNYEAEIASLYFEQVLPTGETRLVSDTLYPRSTFIALEVDSRADLRRIVPVFQLSSGARASIPSGLPTDFSNPVSLTVYSEDGKQQRNYTLSLTLGDFQPFDGNVISFDFERWRVVQDFELPTGGWSASNEGLQIARSIFHTPERYSVRKTEHAHTGRYAVEVSTEKLGIEEQPIAAGSLFLGKFDTSNLLADPLSGPRFGQPWRRRTPLRFTGWYAYTPGDQMTDQSGMPMAGIDEFDLYAVIFYGDPLTTHDVASSERILWKAEVRDHAPRAVYTHFQVPFESTGVIPPPDAQLRYAVVCTSSREGDSFRGAVGSRLLLDDLQITMK